MTQRRLRTDGGCKAKAMPHVSPTPGCHQPCREWGCVSSHTSKSTSPVHGLLTSPPLLTTRTHGTQASGFLGGSVGLANPKIDSLKSSSPCGKFFKRQTQGWMGPEAPEACATLFFLRRKIFGSHEPFPPCRLVRCCLQTLWRLHRKREGSAVQPQEKAERLLGACAPPKGGSPVRSNLLCNAGPSAELWDGRWPPCWQSPNTRVQNGTGPSTLCHHWLQNLLGN